MENNNHATKLGMRPRGEDNGHSILTWKQVQSIRKEHIKRIVTFDMLAEKYGVSKPTIAAIIQRKTWKIYKV